jgi:3-phenylpropionate/trans-cinnamate dioxygenase ferredoxin reductase component
MVSRQRIVVAGGSMAGHSAVSELVDLDAEIVWITGEGHRTYSKPALSKEFMQARSELADLTLPNIDAGSGRLSIVRGQPCMSLDPEAQTLWLADGERIDFDHLIICTGSSARVPSMLAGVPGVFSLRTLEDAMAIRSGLVVKPKTVVIGGGLIGCEFAASMRALGLDAVIVEQLDMLLGRPFGGALSGYFHELHRANGVALFMGTPVERLMLEGGKAAGVVLADGTEIEAGLVLVGAGSQPSTRWLEGSGLELADGIVCDAFLSTSHPAVHAAGDVARWHNPLFDVQMRVEHWTNASAQGRAAARNAVAAVTGRPDMARPFDDLPYFWSDQYGQKIQMVGWHQGHDRAEVEQPEDARGPVARFYRDGRLVAAAAVNGPRTVMRLRKQIEEEARALRYANAS